MYEFIMKNKIAVMITVLAFSYLTKTTSLIAAVMIYLIIHLIASEQSKKVLNILGIAYIATSILFGLIKVILLFVHLGLYDISYTILTMLIALPSIASSLMVLIIGIVYFFKERYNALDKLFIVALLIPTVGGFIFVVEDQLFNYLFEYLISSDSIGFRFSIGSQNSLYALVQGMLLVYIYMKSVDKEVLISEQ